jgi:DNA-binding MarR family transcriptional regulator
MSVSRRNQFDVTNTVCVADPHAVEAAVRTILRGMDEKANLTPIKKAFRLYAQLFTGALPGFVGCDTPYHDARHSLDGALAFARLIDGHDRAVDEALQLGVDRAILGVVIALFHDAGYVRRKTDTADNGACYTLTHVERSAEFLRAHLPRLGLGDQAELAGELVHFTGFERDLDSLTVPTEADRTLGHMLGTADLMSQTADRCYLEKCRDFLYPEFEACGLAGQACEANHCTYPTRESLLDSTLNFNETMRTSRLDGAFGSVHRYWAHHFGGRNLYREAIDENLSRVRRALATDAPERLLSRRPVAWTREPFRQLIKASA